jgi:putative oxidoreductase
MSSLVDKYYSLDRNLLGRVDFAQGLAPLLLRLYLVPIFWMAGTHKIDLATLMPFESTVAWFANPDWGLGLPVPTLMAFLAGWTEILGAILLAGGFAVRWISLPLMVTMLVAAFSVHWEFGWQAIADPMAAYANERVLESADRLVAARSLLEQHGNYAWLTGRGSLVILNNGIEFAATYFIMLLSLFFTGGGRYTSIDYWLGRQLADKS